MGSTFLNVLLAILPLGVRGPCGFHPGLMCGPFTTEGIRRPTFVAAQIRQRFSAVRRGCAADHRSGGSISFGDFTYPAT